MVKSICGVIGFLKSVILIVLSDPPELFLEMASGKLILPAAPLSVPDGVLK